MAAKFPEPKAGEVKTAPLSKRMVTGLPAAPLPWAVRMLVPMAAENVPHKCTVVPGPIWPAPVPQFAALLKNEGGCGLVVQAPCALPSGVINTLVEDSGLVIVKAMNVASKRNAAMRVFTSSPG